MKFEQFPQKDNNDDFYKHRKLSERVDNYSTMSPTHKLEIDFLKMEPDEELPESSEKEIITEVARRYKDKNSINAVHFFNYKGAIVKIGTIKTLGKVIYDINFMDSNRDGWRSHSDVEENVKNIIQEAEEIIQEQE